jgi:hypothetical protein
MIQGQIDLDVLLLELTLLQNVGGEAILGLGKPKTAVNLDALPGDVPASI